MWWSGVFVASIAAAYYYGRYVGEKAYIGYGKSKEDNKQEIKDKSTATDEVEKDEGEPSIICYEEVRDVACQSQVTYLRKRVQPRFMPMPYHEGAYPDPARMKEVF